jgi:hypothetical protein
MVKRCDMDILTVKEAASRWNVSTRRITTLCEQGRIEGAEKIAGVWILPKNAKKPADARVKNGKYIGWRNKTKLSSDDYESNLKSIRGTLAVEGTEISRESINNINRLVSGQTSCSDIVEELKEKYMQRV